jgi:flagellar biosynthesis protein FlhB
MSQTHGESKTHPPSARRLRDARRRGQVAKSTELSAGLSLVAGLLSTIAIAPWAAQQLAHFQLAVNRSVEALSLPAVQRLAMAALTLMAQLSLIPLLIAAAVFLFSTWLQTGSILSLQLVAPKLERLNPAAGLRRLCSIRSLAQLLAMLLKSSIIGAAVALVCHQLLGDVIRVIYADASAALSVANTALTQLLLWCGGLFILLGGIDLLYQRWQHQRDLRMSSSEQRREQRDNQSTGIHQHASLRQDLAHALLPSEQLAHLPAATLLLHDDAPGRVVALLYRPEISPDPICLLRGAGSLGAHMRSLAQQHRIPILSDAALIGRLYPSAQTGHPIPSAHRSAVLAHLHALPHPTTRPTP